MSKAQVRCRPLVLAILVTLLVSALPLTAAQVPHLAEHPLGIIADYDDSDVTPITETRDVRFDVSVQCPQPSIETQLQDHVLTFDIRSDASWALASLDKTTDFVQFTVDECLFGAKKSVQVTATVAFTAHAPAFDQVTFRFTAAIDSGDTAEHAFDLRAGFYERWQARFDTHLIQAGPSEIIQVPLTIENHGNGEIIVNHSINDGSSDALLVALPPDQLVRSLVSGGETNTVTLPIEVRTPDETGRRDRLVIDLSAWSADSTGILLTPLQVTAVVETTQSEAVQAVEAVGELPGVAPLAMFFVLFLGIALRRR